MNRRHTADQAREAIKIVREAGIENLSIDLIFGLSNLSDSTWEATIDEALSLGVDHISCYQLTVEGDNALAHMLEDGDYVEATDEQCWRQYYTLCRKAAAAGFNHYEISNFAKPGFEAIHNGGYWQRKPYVGFGPAAHSFTGRGRGWNSSEIEGYTHTDEALSVEDEKIETLMLALRTSRGIDEEFLRSNCSGATIDSLLGERALVKEGRRFRIPEDHFFVSDEIIRELV
jgi:oxygen-independent coproporphyrinogen-3 oxidase